VWLTPEVCEIPGGAKIKPMYHAKKHIWSLNIRIAGAKPHQLTRCAIPDAVLHNSAY